MKGVIAVIGAVLVLVSIWAVCYFGGFWIYEDAGKRQAGADNRIFHESTPFLDGKVQEINRLRRDYEDATSVQDKQIVRRQILRAADNVDLTKLPPDVQSFVGGLQ